MWVWRETREKWLLAGAVGVLVLIILIKPEAIRVALVE